MSLTPYIRIAPISAALQAGQWTVLLIDPPPVSDELLFKRNDQVYIRSVSEATSASYDWQRNIYDTEYIISKFGQRQTRTLYMTPEATNLFVPNLDLSIIPNGSMNRQKYKEGQQVYLTNNFKYNSQGTNIELKKGTPATIMIGPVTKKGSRSSNPDEWRYRLQYTLYHKEEAVVCYPVAIRAHMLSPHAIPQPSGRAGSM